MKHPLIEYPKQQWWIAAYSHEVNREILARTFLNQRLVLFRKEDGEAVALEGYCPHRNYPFEKGSLSGDAIRCGYHGFEYNCKGQCTHIPSQNELPAKRALRNFPLAEQGGLIWIWLGDEDKADFHLLPDIASMGLGQANWRVEVSPRETLHGRYTLLIDNLMDLTHVSFIHADTIPAGDQVVNIPNELKTTANSINVERIGRHIPSNPFFTFMFPHYTGPVNQHFDTEYFGPCLIRTGGKISESLSEKALGTLNFIHGITPETEHTTHYFVLTARDFATDNSAVGEAHLRMGDMIQPQDMDAIQAIEEGLQQFSAMPAEISCKADVGGLRVRRHLENQIKVELQL